MDNKLIDIILSRLDKIEDKLDTLIAFKYRVIGGALILSLIVTAIFQLCLAFVEGRH